MCGIAGVVQYRSELTRELRAKALRILFSEMMLRTEVRGDDATGIMQLQSDGDWMMAKKGEKASKWLLRGAEEGVDPVSYRGFMESWEQHPCEMTALIGHCRKATIGNKGSDNNDNHPFAVQVDARNAIVGVHNGTLTNHEIVFEKLGGHLLRQGSVDSESIFHLLYYATEHGSKTVDKEVIKHVGRRLEGAYAVVTFNSRFPEKIAVFREGRPMEFVAIRPLNIVLLASEKKFIEGALNQYEFLRNFTDHELPELETESKMLSERDFRIFDTSQEFPSEGEMDWRFFDHISEKGEFRALSEMVLADWKSPTKTTIYSAGAVAHHQNYTKGQAAQPNAAAKTTKAATSEKATESTRVIPSKAGESNGAGTVVGAEIKGPQEKGQDEAKKAFEKASSLGVCTKYDYPGEVASHLGVTALELGEMKVVEVANRLARTHFNFGYAMARVDTKAEIDDVRDKGRSQLGNIEKTARKQKRAEGVIWELKSALQIGVALAACGFPITESNLEQALDGFKELSLERRKAIMKTARTTIFEDQHAQDLVEKLTGKFREVRAKKKARKSSGKKETQET